MTGWLNDDSNFDLAAIDAAIDRERDFNFDYLGLQTLADRYLLKDENDVVIELPQHMLMRVAMGVALNEQTRENRTAFAIDYYNLYSERRALNSTPTLFNSGTLRPQLSSCFGTFIGDSLDGIMDGLKEIAQYSKYSGGCSVDMGSVRATGSRIGSTKGKAGGPIPYLKMYNDTLIIKHIIRHPILLDVTAWKLVSSITSDSLRQDIKHNYNFFFHPCPSPHSSSHNNTYYKF